jgi:hypothetical protein
MAGVAAGSRGVECCAQLGSGEGALGPASPDHSLCCFQSSALSSLQAPRWSHSQGDAPSS